MTTAPTIDIRRLRALGPADIDALADIMIDCVDGGAGVSFMHPLSRETATRFWQRVDDGLRAGHRALVVALDDNGIVGTVQIVLDQPENQPHRADVAKLLVHRRGRGRGIGAALMRAIEETARDCGKSMLVLDTTTGSDAERLYARLGWNRVGVIPDYALGPTGGLTPTTLFYKKV